MLQRSDCLGIMIITGQAAHCAGENHESEHHQRNSWVASTNTILVADWSLKQKMGNKRI